MYTYAAWCEHYGYDPASAEAQADYARYQQGLELFQELPNFQDDGEPLDPPPFITRPR